MRKYLPAAAAALALAYAGCIVGQTPEQEKSWAAERERTEALEKAKAEQLERERAARRADPMAWVRTLDPMTGGGWEFRSVASDGSWAIFTSTHQLKRSGHVMTVWMRNEYAEPQRGEGAPYLSTVEKEQYDCKKDQYRTLLVIYYSANNIQGSEQTEEADGKNTPWSPIVPGTRDEANAQWACAQPRGAGAK